MPQESINEGDSPLLHLNNDESEAKFEREDLDDWME
jgi:hypothetical protein